MFSALFYLQYHSFRNRLTTRIKRLKQPKYLVGAIVGGLYFYYYFFRHFLFVGSRPRGLGLGSSAGQVQLLEPVGALLLFVIVLLAWLIPHERAALTFTEAEVAFLFPAPISRRGLVHFKLLRSQMRILFTVLFFTLISNRFGGNPWIHAAGWWLILSTLNLHFLGSSFARTLLLERGISNWVRRTVVFGFALLAVCAVTFWARRSLPALSSDDTANPQAILEYVQRALSSGPAVYLLYPFRLMVRPFLARTAPGFLEVIGPAMALLVAHYFWVVLSNVAFEEASVEASQKLASKVEAMRSGNWQTTRRNRKAKKPWFKLDPVGPPATALVWKNLLSVGQRFTWRIWVSLGIVCVAFYAGFSGSTRGQDLFTALTFLIGMVLFWSLLVGPQFLRQDFRQDLPVADMLKSYPMRGWQIALGEILAPAILLAGFQWLLLLFAAVFQLRVHRDASPIFLASIVSATILLPVIDAVLLLIPNAAVLMFPSWIQVGREGPRGIEATGQRLVFFFGQLLVLAISLLPASAAFGLAFFLLRLAVGDVLAIPFAALAGALILAVEAGLGVVLVGKLFERFDLSAEGNP